MHTSTHLAKHLRDVHFGGNWTTSNMKDLLADVTWQEATAQVYGLNSIATLVYHTIYFVRAVTQVLQGGPLDAKDKYSFDHPPIQSQKDWEAFRDQALADAETFADLIAQVPESRLWEDFVDNKYGNYFRNLQGIIEHTHYHLGQMAVIKKILRQAGKE